LESGTAEVIFLSSIFGLTELLDLLTS